MKRWCGPSSTSSCNLHCLSASLFFISFLIGFKFGFRQFTKTFQIWFLDKPFAMLDFMDLTLHVHVFFFVDVDCEHVEMLRNTLSRLESNRGHLQLNLYLRLAANQGRWGTAILRSFYTFHFWRFRHMIFFAEVYLTFQD